MKETLTLIPCLERVKKLAIFLLIHLIITFQKIGFPGQFPFTRGVHSNLYRGKLWTMRQFAGFGTPKETNKRFKQLLKRDRPDCLLLMICQH